MSEKRSQNYFSVGRNTVLLLLYLTCVISTSHGTRSYQSDSKLFDDKLGSSSGYKTTVRPLLDQSKVIQVNVSFFAVAIIEVDAIKQQFIINGFLGTMWFDEMVKWNFADYNGTWIMHPEPKQIWRPRMILSNTLGSRDLFEDLQSPVTIFNTGHVTWFPGRLFPASCKLDLYKFPYDVQKCHLELLTNGLLFNELTFHAVPDTVDLQYFVESGEWKIERTSVVATNVPTRLPSFTISFELRRLPGYFVVNIITPVVLMSLLNILVFLIPVESGEKISYGITVLLAVALFMSIVSGQLPRSSDTLPLVTIYLLVLVVISVCTVIMSIIIVYLHYREEKETKHKKAKADFKTLFKKTTRLNQAAAGFKDSFRTGSQNQVSVMDLEDQPGSREKEMTTDKSQIVLNLMKGWRENSRDPTCRSYSGEEEETKCDSSVNRWRQIGKHLDLLSFVVFLVIWLSVTIGFLVEISK